MWKATSEKLNGGKTQRYSLHANGTRLSYTQVLTLWQEEEAFCAFFNALLADSAFRGFRWETPPITKQTQDREFEFVLVESNKLLRRVDAVAFSEHFGDTAAAVAVPNLGGDATLIVPCPRGENAAYGHLAAFVRQAPEQQRLKFWQLVGQTMLERVSDQPLWLSTAGMGVAWLHVRIDSQPKYYHHAAYRDPNYVSAN